MFLSLFGILTDSELLSFINICYSPPFAQYSQLVFQPHISSDGDDENYNSDSHVESYTDKFRCHFFDHDSEDLEETSTSTGHSSH